MFEAPPTSRTRPGKIPLYLWAINNGLNLNEAPEKIKAAIDQQSRLIDRKYSDKNTQPIARPAEAHLRPAKRNFLKQYDARLGRKQKGMDPADVENFVSYTQEDYYFPEINWKSTRAEVRRMLRDYEESDLEP